MIFHLAPDVQAFFLPGDAAFDDVMRAEGEIFRQLEGRCTQRITLGKKSYFLKQHRGVGWFEIIKNIFQLRLPIVGAKNEWLAIQYLTALHLNTMQLKGYGQRGWNPAARESFVLTEELMETISLEDFCRDWPISPPNVKLKHAIIREVARMVRIMHANGLNHRDLYICHFLLKKTKDDQPQLFLIDLHRAQLRKQVPTRWIIKDLAALYFSSRDIGLTSRDIWRFMQAYREAPLATIIKNETDIWQKVKQRGDKLYQDHA